MNKRALSLLAVLAVTVTSGPALAQGMPKSNQFWWPETVDLSPLRAHSERSNPMAADFDYAKEFAKLDLAEVKKDITACLLYTSDAADD